MIRALPRRFLAFSLLLALPAASPAHADLPVEPARVLRELPHDTSAFTEGLFIEGGQMVESTGGVGSSTIRKVDVETGRVLASVSVPGPVFGEGVAPWKGSILSLTWQDGIGFRWRQDGKPAGGRGPWLREVGRFSYLGEGWSLANDGRELIMSDGTDILRFIEPDSFRATRLLRVTAEGRPVRMLNELEYVDGELLANIWLTDRIARIDPANGHVLGWIDVSALHRRAGVFGPDQVPNGIAYDAPHHRLYVTGKQWPLLFEIALPKGLEGGGR